jgi:hypothetical protein
MEHGYGDSFEFLQVYFGGRDVNGNALDDTWFLQRTAGVTDADYAYAWLKGPQTGQPAARSEHSAIAAKGDYPSMYVFGGLSDEGVVLDDVHRLYHGQNGFAWQPIEKIGGTPPGARYGHAAFYDEIPGPNSTTIRRMIMFGGSDEAGSATTDNNVYEMKLCAPDSVYWSVMDSTGLGTDVPSARLGHAMDVDLVNARSKGGFYGKAGHAAFMFGGQTGTSTYSNETWVLWVFNDDTIGWEKLNPSGDVPSARTHATLVCDARQGKHDVGIDGVRLAIFGGQNGSSPSSVIDRTSTSSTRSSRARRS